MIKLIFLEICFIHLKDQENKFTKTSVFFRGKESSYLLNIVNPSMLVDNVLDYYK
jgi:hypothetical protein